MNHAVLGTKRRLLPAPARELTLTAQAMPSISLVLLFT